MTIISSTSAHSVASLYRTRQSAPSSKSLDLEDNAMSNGSRRSVFSPDWEEGNSSASTSSAALKLSSQLWDLMSAQDNAGGAESESSATGKNGASPDSSAASEFQSLSNMTLAERIREKYLEDNKLSEDDLKAMDAQARTRIEEAIRQQVQAALHLQGTNGSAGEATVSAASSETEEA
ncbi:hypothetical protein [Rhizobium oryzicola]|uniref:Uncharacterized protein n=1 Tax=Rhizobium oryzicola TaxID=1232668 RepID=A0ABT8SSS9_9HYPH|nr:hypothetical protein [Rhizobium oryzicola]MDO1581473.1 hypothetical protein [Rhizobium oryzicola]